MLNFLFETNFLKQKNFLYVEKIHCEFYAYLNK